MLKFLIVREQKIQRVKIHSGRKYLTKKFLPLTSTGEIGANFLLAKFLSYTVYTDIPSSRKLSRKRTSAKFEVLRQFTKVFSIKFGELHLLASQASNRQKFSVL